MNLIRLHLLSLVLVPPPFVSCSESVLELSIMPKDEDVLQLVSANMQTHASDTRTHFISLCQSVTGSSLRLFVMIHAVIMEECEDFSKNGCGVTQPLSALCLDYNTYSLKASGIRAYVWSGAKKKEEQLGTHLHAQVLYGAFFTLRRLLHARSHDQTCIIPDPSHQPGTCQQRKKKNPTDPHILLIFSHMFGPNPALTTQIPSSY